MLDIRFCIEQRKNYPIRKASNDDWIEEINSLETKDNLFFVVPEGFLFALNNKQRDEFEKRYSIAGVFDMGSPYVNTGTRMTLVHAVSYPIFRMNIGIFSGAVYERKKNNAAKEWEFTTPKEFNSKFNSYISEIENWINYGTTPDHDKDGLYEFNTIPLEEIDPKKRYPKYYSRKALEIRNLLVTEKTVLLSQVADIIRPFENRDSSDLVKRIRGTDFKYPFNFEAVQEGKPTSVILQKGDIIFSVMGETKPYLFNEELEKRIYASPYTVVIKCRDILPEYLYLYLISDTATTILETVSTNGAIRHISVRDLSELPVVLPALENQKYISDFEMLSNLKIRKYDTQAKRFMMYYTKLQQIQEHKRKPEAVEEIFNIEMVSKIKVHNEQQLRTFLTDDLQELNICFRGKAYKATLILAGSILEAVLIDWLSEIQGKNYFEEDYMVIDRRTGRQKRADLIDYINEIKEIERPNWMEEADKAHEIRKKRNLVHAKLCLKSDDVNENVCRQVIEYLKDVLKTRGVK